MGDHILEIVGTFKIQVARESKVNDLGKCMSLPIIKSRIYL